MLFLVCFSVEIEPDVGSSYETMFHATCLGWEDEHLPLTYQFYRIDSNDARILLAVHTTQNFFDFESPQGTFTIEANM